MAIFKTDALTYRQGGRDVYSFVMDLEEVKRCLPLRVAEDANQIKDTNRAIVPAHARRIKSYLAETDDWVLPAITLAVTSNNIHFEALDRNGMGTIAVSNDDDDERSLFRIVDGQHRRRAIQDLLDDYEKSDEDMWEAFGESGISVTLYAESDPIKIRQMFATMALSKPVDRNVLQQFDSSNPFNNAASHAMENSQILDGGKWVNTQRTNIQSASEEFLTHNDLKGIAIALTLGLPIRAPSQSLLKHYRSDEQQAKIYDNMLVFLDEFLPESHQQFADLRAGEIPPSHLPLKRSDWWVLDPAFVKLLAGCYQMWNESDSNTEPLASYISAGLNFERNMPLGKSDPEGMGLVDDNGTRKKPTRQASQAWKEAARTICLAARDASE